MQQQRNLGLYSDTIAYTPNHFSYSIAYDAADQDENRDHSVSNQNSSGKKRSNMQVYDQQGHHFQDLSIPKKRFVWPEALHRDFISAVFDVGLQSTNVKEIQATMQSDGGEQITSDQYKAHLQKLRTFRDRKRYPRKTYSEMEEEGKQAQSTCSSGGQTYPDKSGEKHTILVPSIQGFGCSNHLQEVNNQGELTDNDLTQAEFDCDFYLQLVNCQIEKVANALRSQNQFVSQMKTSLQRQQRTFNGVMSKMKTLVPNMSPMYDNLHKLSSGSNRNDGAGGQQHYGKFGEDGYPSPTHSKGTRRSTAAAASSSSNDANAASLFISSAPTHHLLPQASSNRTELAIMSEMRATMDLHRKLFLQREDQLSLHGTLQLQQSQQELYQHPTSAFDIANIGENQPSSTIPNAVEVAEMESAVMTNELSNFDPDSFETDIFSFLLNDSGM